ncbi:hypothetical protein OG883_22625 [Streptomyces sp. NBC_01142]|uniref:hypothetical protein n=1 Tax=Streptomyces sp. NBC_01142 TaxID=2975865 RepID=UPI002251DE48|nr:hypothetical protein [Streptomyces sp. NBC_01142]MCX4822641.1 hypothetical protein [Streptomyces sp. NBC_01142]
MIDHSETEQTDDRGCLRWVVGIPLVILYVLAAGLCYTALTIRPTGPWDDGAYAGIISSCLLAIAVSTVALLITVVPSSVRLAMGRWWLAPPLILAAVATLRWIFVP